MATPCKSLLLTVDDAVGKLAEVTGRLADAGLNILAVCAWVEGTTGKMLLCTDDNEKACATVREAGLTCDWKEGICVEADNRPGALQRVAQALAEAGINIEVVYATATDGPKARVVLHTSDNAKAAEVV